MTETQLKLLTFLRAKEVTPSYREMAAHLGWKSWGGIKPVIDGLIAQGYVKRFPGKDRGLRVISPDVEAMKAALPDEIDLYHTIKAAPDKSHIGIARHIIKTHWPEAIKILEEK